MTSLLTSEQKNALKLCIGKVYLPSGKSTVFKDFREEEDGLVITLEFKHTYEMRIPYCEVEDFIAGFIEDTPDEDDAFDSEPINNPRLSRTESYGTSAPNPVQEAMRPTTEKMTRKRKQILEIIGRKPIAHKELMKETDMKEISLYYHTTALKKDGLILRNKEGKYTLNTAYSSASAPIPKESSSKGIHSDIRTKTEGQKHEQLLHVNAPMPGEDFGLEEMIKKCMQFHKNKYEKLKMAMEIICNN